MKPAPEFDRGSIARAADELEEHYRAALEDRGGRLSVAPGLIPTFGLARRLLGSTQEWSGTRRAATTMFMLGLHAGPGSPADGRPSGPWPKQLIGSTPSWLHG
jgi:hypothetical protein